MTPASPTATTSAVRVDAKHEGDLAEQAAAGEQGNQPAVANDLRLAIILRLATIMASLPTAAMKSESRQIRRSSSEKAHSAPRLNWSVPTNAPAFSAISSGSGA
jgi:hypothetical protein